MNLATPMALAWVALAVPIVIFYILKIRLRRVPVTTTLFWSQIYEERRPRSIWQQLRHLLSLLVQLAFLALVVFALADPYWFWEQLQARRMVLIIDNSASMNATDVPASRLAAAGDHARRLIRGLRARDEMALLSAASVPQVACGLTGHQRTLRNALEGVRPTDGPTHMLAAVDLARRLLAGHERGRIIILSDGRFPGREQLAADADVELITLGTPAGNVGITQFQVRRSLVDTIGYQILLTVQNFSDEPIECRLEIDREEQVVDVLPLKLAAGETFSRTLDHVSSSGGQLVARLDHPDVLSVDNQAVALLPQREVQRVLLVTQGSHYLQRVLEAMPAIELQTTNVLPDRVPPDTVVIYHRQTPATLPRAQVMVIDPVNSNDAWTLGEELPNPLVGKQQTASPLLTHVRLDNVWMPSARKLEFVRETQPLITAVTDEVLYAARETRDTQDRAEKLLVLTVDLEQGDLPLRTAFPILMTNALSWFQGSRGELRESLPTGSIYEARLEGEQIPPSRQLVLRSPAGTLTPLAVGAAGDSPSHTTVALGPLDQCGVWRIEAAAPAAAPSPGATASPPPPPLLELAVNLASAAESDVRTAQESLPPSTLDLAGLAGRPVWFYFTLAATLLICLEWWLYQRRWIS